MITNGREQKRTAVWWRTQSYSNPSLPAIWEMQGNFAEMQGEVGPHSAKKSPDSKSLDASLPNHESRETMIRLQGDSRIQQTRIGPHRIAER